MGKSIHSVTYLTHKIQLKFHSYSHECMLLLELEEETAVKSSVIEKKPLLGGRTFQFFDSER